MPLTDQPDPRPGLTSCGDPADDLARRTGRPLGAGRPSPEEEAVLKKGRRAPSLPFSMWVDFQPRAIACSRDIQKGRWVQPYRPPPLSPGRWGKPGRLSHRGSTVVAIETTKDEGRWHRPPLAMRELTTAGPSQTLPGRPAPIQFPRRTIGNRMVKPFFRPCADDEPPAVLFSPR